MSKTPNTPITIRVQARDGMFLGPDSYDGAIISLTNVLTKEVLVSGFTDQGDSGSRSETYVANSSPSPIVTPGTLQWAVNWVVASEKTVQYTTAIQIEKPILLKIEARIPLPSEQSDQFVSATQWIIPETGLQTGAGFVLEIPGLWIQPEVVANQDELRIRAKVTMMCGCEINDKSPWIPEDFEVTASIQMTTPSSQNPPQIIPLDFEVNSQFIGSFKLTQKGSYEVTISAFQKSSGNMGVARFLGKR